MEKKSSEELFVEVKEEKEHLDAPAKGKKEDNNHTLHESIYVSSDEENGHHEFANDNQASAQSKQLVPYDPKPNGSHDNKSDEAANQLVPYEPKSNGSNGLYVSNAPRVLPAVGAFTVQCAECFKWRFIPTKERYEQIREHILAQPFVCEEAKEWRPEISCEEPADIEQDGTRLWAIDKPSIAQPPPGWERELRIRGEGCSKFADVYYIAPTGKRLRSMVEVERYLTEYPEFVQQGVQISQFSFRIPKPLQENYVRKRRTKSISSLNTSKLGTPSLVGPKEVRPLSITPAEDSNGMVLRITGPESCSPQPCGNYNAPPKKQRKLASAPVQSSDKFHDRIKTKMGYSQQPANNIW